MQRKSFARMVCPIARALEHVGEWWSILILRDALHGLRRFDEFQNSLGIAPNMLTRRLNALVEAGLLQRRRYSARPPRHEYVPTERGRDFHPVLVALVAWGNKHFAPEGPSVLLVNTMSGEPAEPVLVDQSTGRPIREPEYAFAAGPAAGERTRRRYALLQCHSRTEDQPANSEFPASGRGSVGRLGGRSRPGLNASKERHRSRRRAIQ